MSKKDPKDLFYEAKNVYEEYSDKLDTIKDSIKQERTRFFREVIIRICKKFAFNNRKMYCS